MSGRKGLLAALPTQVQELLIRKLAGLAAALVLAGAGWLFAGFWMAMPPLMLGAAFFQSSFSLGRAVIMNKLLILTPVCSQVRRRGLLHRRTDLMCTLEGKTLLISSRANLSWLKTGERFQVLLNADTPLQEKEGGYILPRVYGVVPEKNENRFDAAS